jgi:hypothetical protein
MRTPDPSSGLEAKWQVAEDIEPVDGVGQGRPPKLARDRLELKASKAPIVGEANWQSPNLWPTNRRSLQWQ